MILARCPASEGKWLMEESGPPIPPTMDNPAAYVATHNGFAVVSQDQNMCNQGHKARLGFRTRSETSCTMYVLLYTCGPPHGSLLRPSLPPARRAKEKQRKGGKSRVKKVFPQQQQQTCRGSASTKSSCTSRRVLGNQPANPNRYPPSVCA